MAGDSVVRPCSSPVSAASVDLAGPGVDLELPSTTVTSCSLIFLSQAKLKSHSLEPRSQEQPLLQPKQVQPLGSRLCSWHHCG